MATTPYLDLPLIAGSQAQKHVTHNEALDRLDALVQSNVVSVGQNTPPLSPVDGQNFIVGANPSGLWANQAQRLASWRNGSWIFATPRDGWQVFSSSDQCRLVFNMGTWAAPAERFEKIAINTGTNASDRLTIRAAASLFTNEGNDHRLKINKAAVSDTASIVFQTAFSGRAEFGLNADDTFRLKVSANGSSWTDALTVDATGKIGLGTIVPQSAIDVVNRPSGALAEIAASNYGTGSGGIFQGQYAAGTLQSPAAPPAGSQIAAFGGRTFHNGGAFQPSFSAGMQTIAVESPTATSWGTGLAFVTTQIGTISRKRAAWITPSGMIWAIDSSNDWDAANSAQTGPISGSMIQASASAASGATACMMNTVGYGNVTPGFRGLSARGTNLAPSASLTGDAILVLAAHGHDGAGFSSFSSAQISCRTEATWTVGSKSTYITFETTPQGSVARTERLRINGAGDIGIGISAPTTKLHVAGPIRCGSFVKAALPNAAATGAGAMIYVTDDIGGAVLAFSDGSAWRRVTDRAIIA